MTLRNILLGATMLCAATTPALAFAQDTAPATPAATDDGTETFDDADYGNDIIVTATGRAQRSQDIPIAVNVVGGEQLENSGISDIRGLRQIAPSFQATTGQSTATGVVLRIRGIGTAGDNPGFEPSVGVFVDGVFRARAGLALADLPPIDRVEVLRGPQGTLFGRNTSAGALNIITQKPSFNLGGYAEASYGNLDEIELKAGVTGPVSETLAVRLDGGYHKRDGYIKDVNSDRRFNDLDRWSVRGQALFEKDDVSFRLIADYARTDEQCCGALNTNSGFAQPGTPAFAASAVIQGLAAANGLTGIVTPFNPKDREVAYSPARDLTEKMREWGVSGQLDWDLGGVELTSITAWRDWKATRGMDVDFSGIDRAYRENMPIGMRDFTQEIRLKGTAFDDHVDWLIGGFYLNEKLNYTERTRFGTQGAQYVDAFINALTDAAVPGPTGFQIFQSIPNAPLVGQVLLASNPQLAAAAAQAGVLDTFLTPLPGPQAGQGQVGDRYRVDTEAFALFTHNIIDFNDNVSLTLGLRYNHETKKLDADLQSNLPGCATLQSTRYGLYRQALQGLPSGLGNAIFNLVCNPVVNPEFNGIYRDKRSESKLTGTAKLSVKLDERVMVYGGYDRGYKSGGYNLDRGSFDTAFLGGNGAQASDLEFGNEDVDSFEFGVKTDLSTAFQFNANAFYTELKGYQNLAFEGNNFVVQNFDKVVAQGVELESIIRPAPNLNIMLGYSYIDTEVKDPVAGPDNGLPLTNSPKHVVTGAVTWTPQLSSNVGGLLHVDWRMNSDANTINDPVAVPFTTNDGYTIVNARAGLNFGPDQNYAVEFYVENLFNKYYNITAFPIPEQSASFAVYPAPPRLYGVKLRAKF